MLITAAFWIPIKEVFDTWHSLRQDIKCVWLPDWKAEGLFYLVSGAMRGEFGTLHGLLTWSTSAPFFEDFGAPSTLYKILDYMLCWCITIGHCHVFGLKWWTTPIYIYIFFGAQRTLCQFWSICYRLSFTINHCYAIWTVSAVYYYFIYCLQKMPRMYYLLKEYIYLARHLMNSLKI